MDQPGSDRRISHAVRRWLQRRAFGGRRAAVAVELALVLPLFVTLVLASVDFGRLAYMYLSTINASRAAAGLATCTPYSAGSLLNWQRAVREAVVDEMSEQHGFDDTRLTIGTPVVSTEPGTGFRRVAVTVTYRFHTIVDWPLLPGQLDLVQKVEMRQVR